MPNAPHDQRSRNGGTGTSATDAEWPIPREGLVVTHLLIVRDIDRSRRFYSEVLGARTLMEGPPAILRFANPPRGRSDDWSPGGRGGSRIDRPAGVEPGYRTAAVVKAGARYFHGV